MQRAKNQNFQRLYPANSVSGFSLVQLLVAITLAAVVTNFALTLYHQFRDSEDAATAKLAAQAQTMDFSNTLGEYLATRTMSAPLKLDGHKLTFQRQDLREDFRLNFRIVTGCETMPNSVKDGFAKSDSPPKLPKADHCSVGCPEGKRPAVLIKRSRAGGKELKMIRLPALASHSRRDILGAYFCGSTQNDLMTYYVGAYYLDHGQVRQITQTRSIKLTRTDNNIEWLPTKNPGN